MHETYLGYSSLEAQCNNLQLIDSNFWPNRKKLKMKIKDVRIEHHEHHGVITQLLAWPKSLTGDTQLLLAHET